MMAAILLFGLLGMVALAATGAMIGTWRQYESAWNALEAERSGNGRASARDLTVRAINDRQRTKVPGAELRTRLPADRQWRGLRAAA